MRGNGSLNDGGDDGASGSFQNLQTRGVGGGRRGCGRVSDCSIGTIRVLYEEWYHDERGEKRQGVTARGEGSSQMRT